MAGESFNINSPKQLGVILFEKLLLPGSKKTKSGYSTAASVLDKLAPDYPIVSKVLEYRQLTKLKSTYADGLVNYIEEDGRIHSKFNQTSLLPSFESLNMFLDLLLSFQLPLIRLYLPLRR